MNEQIAIILATYNPNIEFFTKQIDSIKKQTYQNWTCIVIDDCSSPNKAQEIKNLIQEDKRFLFFQNEINLGSYYTFEQGLLKLSSLEEAAELICFSDQDDIWLPEKLEILAEEFNDSEISCIHSDLSLIDEKDNLIHESCWLYEKRSPEIYEPILLILRNTITGCSMMFRRRVLAKALPLPEQQIRNSFHHDLWIGLISSQYGRIKALNKPLVLYRQHANNVVGASKVDNGKFYLFSLVKKLFLKVKTFKDIKNSLTYSIEIAQTNLNLRIYLSKIFFDKVQSKIFISQLAFHNYPDFGISLFLFGIYAFSKNYYNLLIPWLIIAKIIKSTQQIIGLFSLSPKKE